MNRPALLAPSAIRAASFAFGAEDREFAIDDAQLGIFLHQPRDDRQRRLAVAAGVIVEFDQGDVGRPWRPARRSRTASPARRDWRPAPARTGFRAARRRSRPGWSGSPASPCARFGRPSRPEPPRSPARPSRSLRPAAPANRVPSPLLALPSLTRASLTSMNAPGPCGPFRPRCGLPWRYPAHEENRACPGECP